MDRKAHAAWLEDFTRNAIAEYKTRDPNQPTYSSEKVHNLLLELQRRFEQAGKADPAIAEELIGKLERGEAF